MKQAKEKWELALIPIILISALIMIGFLEGCKGNNGEKEINTPSVTKPTDKPIENDEPENPVDPIKPDNNNDNDSNTTITESPTDNTAKKSNYTGEVVICLSNNTFGWVLPCG